MVDERHTASPDEPTAESQLVAGTSRGVSLIWLVPVIAVLVGGWILYKSYADKGPTITIEFTSAAGVVAGKTLVRYRDVEIGKITAVAINDDLSGVTVTAELQHGSERLLGKGTRFWVEQPEVSLTGVRGLETMLSGVYIGVDPDTKGRTRRSFAGLDDAPFIGSAQGGRYFVLDSPSRAAFNRGAPVMFRGYKVGQIVSDKLVADGSHVEIRVFVQAPYHEHITADTRFWNTSGVDVEMSADGIRVRSKALVSILIGGVSFENPPDRPADDTAPEEAHYTLFENRELAFEPNYRKLPVLVYFDSSVRGLSVGAPVEFHGVRIGEVTNIRLEMVAPELTLRIPVHLAIEPQRLSLVGQMTAAQAATRAAGGDGNIRHLIALGLRAQIKTGSLLTGQKLVDFDIQRDTEPVAQHYENGVLVIPSVPTMLDSVTEKVTGILDKLQQLPLEAISEDLRGALQAARHLMENADTDIGPALKSLTRTLDEADKFAQQLNTSIGPRATATLGQADAFAARLNTDMAPQMEEALRELKDAARAIRAMSDYLERHPDALLKGKKP